MDAIKLPQKLKLPSHVKEFRCAQCGECCTDKWVISVDGVSYEKLYKKLAELDRQQELHDNIHAYGVARQIRFLANGKCPYLSDDNRCSIQKEIGEEYLLDICKEYPRHIFASQQAIEFALSLTCRTAVKTLSQEKIRIIETDWPLKEREDQLFSFIQPNTIKRYFPDKSPLGDPRLPYHVLEDRFIELLQDRRYPVSQRLVALGQLLDRLNSRSKAQGSNNTTEDLSSILSENYCYTAEPDWERHLSQLFGAANRFLPKSPSVMWAQILRSMLLTISSGEPHPVEDSEIVRLKIPPPGPGKYQQKLGQYYRPAYGLTEHILENYLVNFILSKSFYLRPVHLAYYRMAFAYAAIIAFALGYGILSDQAVSQQTMLQAIYDVENIFYSSWFYPFATCLQAGKSFRQTIDSGIALANI